MIHGRSRSRRIVRETHGRAQGPKVLRQGPAEEDPSGPGSRPSRSRQNERRLAGLGRNLDEPGGRRRRAGRSCWRSRARGVPSPRNWTTSRTSSGPSSKWPAPKSPSETVIRDGSRIWNRTSCRLPGARTRNCSGKNPRCARSTPDWSAASSVRSTPGMDMVSFGPTLEGVHSPDETIPHRHRRPLLDLPHSHASQRVGPQPTCEWSSAAARRRFGVGA